MILRQDEVKISLNFYMTVKAAACTSHPGTPQSPKGHLLDLLIMIS